MTTRTLPDKIRELQSRQWLRETTRDGRPAWGVPSLSVPGRYWTATRIYCTCYRYQHGYRCHHLLAVRAREEGAEQPVCRMCRGLVGDPSTYVCPEHRRRAAAQMAPTVSRYQAIFGEEE